MAHIFRYIALSACVGITALSLTVPAVSSQPCSSDIDYAGLDGKGIAAKIAADMRPERYASSVEDLRRVVAGYAALGGGFRDYFSNASANSVSELTMLPVAPVSWWGSRSPYYACVAFDLNNIVPANSQVESVRSDYPPGEVSEPQYDNGVWSSGIGTISGVETNFYAPPHGLRGDFARIYMYMSVMYPQSLWEGRGIMLMVDGGYPFLSRYGRETLLAWHREDPVDDDELARDKAVAEYQGAGNPFVSMPELAEYIWGRHADEVYEPDEGSSEDPSPVTPPEENEDTGREPVMLKASYSISRDIWIDFRSPYVAAGSQWSFDGRVVSGSSIELSTVTEGSHEISYENENSRGKIIITVTP